MDQQWDLSIPMTDRYTLDPLGGEYLSGDEVEQGIEIPMIKPRTSKISRDEGNRYRM